MIWLICDLRQPVWNWAGQGWWEPRNGTGTESISLNTEDIAMHEKGDTLTRILGKHTFLSSLFLYLAGGLCWYSDTLRLRSVSCPRVSDILFAGVQSIAAVSSLMSQGITHTERRTNMPLLRLHTKSPSIFLHLWPILSHMHAQTGEHTGTQTYSICNISYLQDTCTVMCHLKTRINIFAGHRWQHQVFI